MQKCVDSKAPQYCKSIIIPPDGLRVYKNNNICQGQG